jgi:hypothetical protein
MVHLRSEKAEGFTGQQITQTAGTNLISAKGGWMVGGWRMPALSFLFFHLTITGTIHLWLTSIDKLSVGRILVSMIVKMASRWIVQQHRQLWRGFFRLQQHFNHWHFCKTLILEVESNSELTTLELAVRKVMQRERERERESYLHIVRPFSFVLGTNHIFLRAGDSNCTKNPSLWSSFHFLDPCPFQTCM